MSEVVVRYLLWCLPFFRFFLSLRLGGVSWHLGRSCEPSVSTTLLFRTSWSVAFTPVRNCTLMPCSQVALGPLVNEIHESVVFSRPPFRDWHEWDGTNVVCHTWRNACVWQLVFSTVTRTPPWTARSPMRCRLSSILSCQVRRENMWMLRVLWNCCAPSRGSSTMSYVKWHDHVPGYCRVRDEGTRGGGSIHDEFAEVLFQPSFIWHRGLQIPQHFFPGPHEA